MPWTRTDSNEAGSMRQPQVKPSTGLPVVSSAPRAGHDMLRELGLCSAGEGISQVDRLLEWEHGFDVDVEHATRR